MNLKGLIAAVHTDADDLEDPPLLSTANVVAWLNEAEEEAAVRRRLLFEGDLEEMCLIDVEAGTRSYALDPRWFCITRAWLTDASGCVRLLHLTSRDALDRIRPDWRTKARDPDYLIQYDTRVEIGAPVAKAWQLHLEGYRLPLKPMLEDEQDDAQPEIGAAHHLYLRHWALHRGYSIPDTEVFDLQKAARAEAEFTRYFGPRPDADLRKDLQADQPHHNEAIW